MSNINFHTLSAGLALAVSLATAPAAWAVCGNGIVDPNELCFTAASANIWPTAVAVAGVVSGDVNGDGFPDVAAVSGNQSFVRLGNGAGFGAFSFFNHAGASFRDLALGDFDSDGDLDLALADFAGNRVIVRWNTGGGNFSAGDNIAVGAGPVRVLAARLNADARWDFVTLNDTANTATVRLRVAGGWAAAVNYAVGDARDITLGDCDASGSQDLIYLNNQGTATVLQARRNNGAGGLLAPVGSSFPLFDPLVGYLEPLALVAGRFNPDAFADVMVSASQSRVAPGVSVGGCSFLQGTFGLTWAWSFRLRALDLDENGDLDVAAPHGVAPRYSLAWGDGVGGVLPYSQTLVPGAGDAHDLTFADFSGDGETDVVVASDVGLLYQRGTP